MENGINIYALLPLPIIIKNRLIQSPNQSWKQNQWFPSLATLAKIDKRMVNTEFCKNLKKIKEFYATIEKARREIINMDVLTPEITMQLLNFDDQLDVENINHFLEIIAKTIENLDFDSRHDQNEILILSTPRPNAKFMRRTNSGRSKEEKIFISMMQKMPKCMKSIQEAYPKGIMGSNEFKLEVEAIKKAKNFEVQYQPIDLEAVFWFRRRKVNHQWKELEQWKHILEQFTFDEIEGQFNQAICQKEKDIIESMTSKMDQLIDLQKEKEFWMQGQFSEALVNSKCFPMLAEIVKNSSANKTLDIVDCTDDENSDSFQSWSGSWSSD